LTASLGTRTFDWRQNAGIHSNNELYKNKSSAVAQMGDRLATIEVARKVGAAVFLWW